MQNKTITKNDFGIQFNYRLILLHFDKIATIIKIKIFHPSKNSAKMQEYAKKAGMHSICDFQNGQGYVW